MLFSRREELEHVINHLHCEDVVILAQLGWIIGTWPSVHTKIYSISNRKDAVLAVILMERFVHPIEGYDYRTLSPYYR